MRRCRVAVRVGAARPGRAEGLVSPSSASLSEVANSVTRIFMSKPASAAIAWITSATCRVSGLFGTMKSIVSGVVTPASLSSALALAMSRFGSGKFCW